MKTIATKIPSVDSVHAKESPHSIESPHSKESPQTVASVFSAWERSYSSPLTMLTRRTFSIVSQLSRHSYKSHSDNSYLSNSSGGKCTNFYYARYQSEFDELISNEKKLVVVDFFATWCGPCKAIAPQLQKWAEEYDDVLFVKIDVDENDETAEFCGITAMPTFFFYKNGVKIDEIVGANCEKIKEKILCHTSRCPQSTQSCNKS